MTSLLKSISWSVSGHTATVHYNDYRENGKLRISVTHIETGRSWLKSTLVPIETVFDRSVWRGNSGSLHCRLFSDDNRNATLVGLDVLANKIHVFQWTGDFPQERLQTKDPVLKISEDGAATVEWEDAAPREEDPEANVFREQNFDENFGKKALVAIGVPVAAAIAARTAYLSIGYFGNKAWNAGSFVSNAIYDYALAPAAAATIETMLSYPVIGAAALGAGILVTDAYRPDWRIIPTIRENAERFLGNNLAQWIILWRVS